MVVMAAYKTNIKGTDRQDLDWPENGIIVKPIVNAHLAIDF
jgi:hypothetical protein